jgi:isopenicillin-N epimerase
LDIARRSFALRNRVRQRPPGPSTRPRELAYKTHKIRIRGGDPNKLRLSTPYYLQKKDIDRFLNKFDEYKREKKLT